MVTGIIGRKVGMTQIFDADGTVHPATVIKAGRASSCRRRRADRRLRGGAARARRGDAGEGRQAARRPLQEGQRAADARAARGEAGAGRRGAEGRRPGAGRRSSPTASAWTSSAPAAARASRASSSATTSPAARRRTARCSIARPARLAPRRFPSRVMKGMRAAGRMGGGRVTIHNLKVLRVDAGQPPADRRGRHPRRADRLRDRPQGGRRAKKLKVAQVEKPQEGQEVAELDVAS